MLPSEYHCLEPADFIGPARAMAEYVAAIARKAREGRSPVRFAFLGQPGIGKSELGNFLTACLGASKWSTYEKNGASFRIEDVEEWSRTCQLMDLYGDYRVFRIEEVDKASNAAQVALLTFLDRLPTGNAFICTTNKSIKELEARFQRRIQVFNVDPPSMEEIAQFLHSRFSIEPRAAASIARGAVLSCGFVGQALQDANAEVCRPQGALIEFAS